MVDIRNGLIGLSVAGHVMEELKIMTVHAPTPRLLTEEKTAAEWDELTSHGHVTHIGAQVNDCAIEKSSCAFLCIVLSRKSRCF